MSTANTTAIHEAAKALAEEFGEDLHQDHEVLAATVIEAALGSANLAEVLKRHRLDGLKTYGSRSVCACGWVGHLSDHEAHVAAAVRVVLLGEAA